MTLQPDIHEAFGVWKFPFHKVKLRREPGGYRSWVIDLLEEEDTHVGTLPIEQVEIGDKIADDMIADTPYWEVVEVDEDALRITVKAIPPNPFETGVGAGGAPITEYDMAVFSGEYERERVDAILDRINANLVFEYRDVAYILKGTVPLQMGPNGAQGGWYTATDTWSNRGGREGMTPEQIMQTDANTLRELGLPVPTAALDGTLAPRVWNDLLSGNTVTDPLAMFPGENLDDPRACLSMLLTHPLPDVKKRNFEAIQRKFPDYLEQAIRIAARLPVVGEFDRYWLVRENAIMTAERTLDRIDLVDLFVEAHDPTNRKYVAWAYGSLGDRDRLMRMFERETQPEALYGILGELQKVGVDIQGLMAAPGKQRLIQDIPGDDVGNYHREQIRLMLRYRPHRTTSGPPPDPDYLGNAIRGVLDESYDLLPRGTWLAGGCWIAAAGLRKWLTPTFGRLVAIYADRDYRVKRPHIEHVPVEIRTEVGLGYLDGDGYSTQTQLLDKWERVERLRNPHLTEFERKYAVKDCGWNADAAAELTRRFSERLGEPGGVGDATS